MSQTNRPFQFIGVSPYVDRAAEALKLADPRLIGKARNIEHLARIQTALGQASRSSPEDRAAIFEQALAFRSSLAVALLAAEYAIVEVAEALGLGVPSFEELNLDLAAAHHDQPARGPSQSANPQHE
jgi:hypothetical protein